MSKRVAYFDYGNVWREGAPPPLVDGAPPLVTPDDAPRAPAPLPARRVLRRLWALVFVGVQLAVLLMFLADPLPAGYVSAWENIPVGGGAYFVLLGITIVIWRITR